MKVGATWVLATVALMFSASPIGAQDVQTGPPVTPVTPVTLVQPEASSGPPLVLTLQDALQRAKQNDAQFQASAADSASAREDRVQAKAGLLPALSHTTQYLGNQSNGVNPNGRFVSMDGVNMYSS